MAWQKQGFIFQERRENVDHDYAPEILKKKFKKNMQRQKGC